MLEVHEMLKDEMHLLLNRAPYGHLGCARYGRPYIVPIHFVFQDPFIFVYTTEGMKTEFIEENAEVCLQAEEVESPSHWCSVIVTGRAERITDSADRDAAMSEMSRKHEYSRPGDRPALVFTKVENLAASRGL